MSSKSELQSSLNTPYETTDIDYVRAQCYRTCFIYTLCKTIVELDKIPVSELERRKSYKKMRKLRSIVNSKNKFVKDLSDCFEGLDGRVEVAFNGKKERAEVEFSGKKERAEVEFNGKKERKEVLVEEKLMTPFKNWKPVSQPMSRLKRECADVIRVEIRTPLIGQH